MKFSPESLQRDVLVLMASRGVRAFAFSYLSIVFAIYLAQLGFSTVTVGLVFSTGYATSALHFDYAYVPSGLDIGDTHRFSLSTRF